MSTPGEALRTDHGLWRKRWLRAAMLLDDWVMSAPARYAALAAGGAGLAAAAMHLPRGMDHAPELLAFLIPGLLLFALAGGVWTAIGAILACLAAVGLLQPGVAADDVPLLMFGAAAAASAGVALREIARLVLSSEARIAEIEMRFRSIADAAPVLIWVAGPDQRCSWFNEAWLDFTGRTLDQELGFGWAEGVHPDDRDRCIETFTRAFDARRPFRMEYRLRRHDSEYRWVDDTGIPSFASNGGFQGYSGACIDIHERKELEERLRDSERRFKSYADTTTDCLWAIDARTMEVEYLSPGFEKIWRIPAETLKRNLDEWVSRIHPDDRGKIISQIPQARKGVAFENEYRFLRGDGQWRWLNDMGVAARDTNGEVVRLAGISRDITDRKAAEAALRESEQRARIALDAAPAAWLELMDTCARTGLPQTTEVYTEALGRRWFDARIFRAGDDQIAVLFRDITRQRQLMEDLRGSEERLRLAQKAGRVGLLDWNVETDEVVWSEQHHADWELPLDQKPTLYEFRRKLHPEDRLRVLTALKQALEGGDPYSAEYRVLQNDGSEIWMHTAGEVLYGPDGRPKRMVGVNVNITELKQAEERARESELRFRCLVDATTSLVWSADIQGRFVNRQPRREDYTGQSHEDYRGFGWINAVHPEDRAALADAWNAAIADCTLGESIVIQHTARLWHAASGSYRYVQMRAVPIRNSANEVREWMGSSTDIHEQVLAESQLRSSEERLRRFVDSDVIGITVTDRKGNVLSANDEFLRIVGYSRDELATAGLNTRDITPIRLHAADRSAFRKAQKTGVCPRYEKSYMRRDGTEVPVLVGYVVAGETMIAFILDLTEQKRIENELKIREREANAAATELQKLYDMAPIGIGVVDEEMRYLRINDRLAEYNGLRKEDHIGRSAHEIVPDFAAQCADFVQRIRQTGETITGIEITREVPGGKGVSRSFEESWFPIPDEDGTIRRVGVVLAETTQRRAMEEALKASEERFRSFAEATDDAIWVYDVAAQRLEYLNPAFERVWGVSRDFMMADLSRWRDQVYPDDRERAMAALPQVQQGDAYEVEYRIIRPDGKIRWINASGFAVFDAEGRVRRVAGLARDITERRRAEERQKLLLAELNHRVKNSLATVQSLALQTIRNSSDLQAFKENFEARLIALAKTHDVLTRSHWEGARLEDVLEEELAPYRTGAGQINIDGEELHLAPAIALSLGLVMHELATNAAKYGALSASRGSLHIAWRLEKRGACDWVRVTWTEAGGPAVREPARRGFGMMLLSRTIEDELGGETSMLFDEDGLRCNFAFALER